MKNLKNCSPLTNIADTDEFKAFVNAQAYQKLPDRDQSMKADAGKPMLELIPQSLYRDLGAVLTFGANKYGPNTRQDLIYFYKILIMILPLYFIFPFTCVIIKLNQINFHLLCHLG